MSAKNQVHPAPEEEDKDRDDASEGKSDDEDYGYSGPAGPDMSDTVIAGYENVGGTGQESPYAPPPAEPSKEPEAPHVAFTEVGNLTEDQCREAVLEFVAQHCCYGKGCAQDHKITQVLPSTALHYTLETYTEGRKTSTAFEPYGGGPIDGPENGRPPPPWSISCQPCELFEDEVRKLEVPHTSTIKMCHRCGGDGRVICPRCHGSGRIRCTTCGGSGRRTFYVEGQRRVTVCGRCGGSCRIGCHRCDTSGRVVCRVCTGFGQLRCYILLTVTFTNHEDDYILEKTDMPDKLVRDVQGIPIFEQTLPQVLPITAYPVKEVNDNSIRLVQQHRTAFPTERQLQQCHELRVVPVTEVHFIWKETQDRYFIYGLDKKVYFPTYPQKCCWGCQIL